MHRKTLLLRLLLVNKQTPTNDHYLIRKEIVTHLCFPYNIIMLLQGCSNEVASFVESYDLRKSTVL